MENRGHYLQLLSGSGIEIGALHRPVDVPHLSVKYVDRLSKEDLFKQYPELIGHDIVEADIIDDAEKLNTVADRSQDFVIANHVIEHMANPISSIKNWLRVLKVGGKAFLAVPDKHNTFDRERPITPIDHIVLDYTQPDEKRDFEHFKEFALHVSCRTFNVVPESEVDVFTQKLWDTQYSIHYHVWDHEAFLKFLATALEMIAPIRVKVVASMPAVGDEFIIVLERIVDHPH